MFLEIKNITKKYGEKTAVDNVSFSLEEGRLLTLLGPSGCGKTTILRAIGGFLKLDQGSILLNGQDISPISPEEREVATVFQSYGLFPNMKVYENVAYGLKFRGIRKKEARNMAYDFLNKVHLEEEGEKYPSQLSGGQQQRVALARSLIIKPKLLLLDEPLSNLDAKLREQMREEIRQVQQEFGVTMIFVTHDQNEAFSISDEVMLMNEGKLIQKSSPEDLYLHPNSAFALDFIGQSNIKKGFYCRPEDIKLSSEGSPLKVQSIEYLGDFVQYTVLDKDGTKLIMKQFLQENTLEINKIYPFFINWRPIDFKTTQR